MKQKLNCVLLIDDDNIVNFINKKTLGQLDCAEKIIVAKDGKEAIDLLSKQPEKKYRCPELIFLDINMPKMNGWEFLEAYKKLNDGNKLDPAVIVMLTTSINPDDKERANSIEEISAFQSKPLTKETVNSIFDKHFFSMS